MNEFVGSIIFALVAALIMVAIWSTLPFWPVAFGAWVFYWVGVVLYKGEVLDDLGSILD